MTMTSKSYPIWVEFTNKQEDDTGEQSVVKIRAAGTLYKRKKDDVILYKEAAPDIKDETTFTMTMPHDKDEVLMNRFGEHQLRIHFKEGNHYESKLQTPFGLVNLAFITQALDVQQSDDGGQINISYLLDLNHTKPIRNEVSLKYRFLTE